MMDKYNLLLLFLSTTAVASLEETDNNTEKINGVVVLHPLPIKLDEILLQLNGTVALDKLSPFALLLYRLQGPSNTSQQECAPQEAPMESYLLKKLLPSEPKTSNILTQNQLPYSSTTKIVGENQTPGIHDSATTSKMNPREDIIVAPSDFSGSYTTEGKDVSSTNIVTQETEPTQVNSAANSHQTGDESKIHERVLLFESDISTQINPKEPDAPINITLLSDNFSSLPITSTENILQDNNNYTPDIDIRLGNNNPTISVPEESDAEEQSNFNKSVTENAINDVQSTKLPEYQAEDAQIPSTTPQDDDIIIRAWMDLGPPSHESNIKTLIPESAAADSTEVLQYTTTSMTSETPATSNYKQINPPSVENRADEEFSPSTCPDFNIIRDILVLFKDLGKTPGILNSNYSTNDFKNSSKSQNSGQNYDHVSSNHEKTDDCKCASLLIKTILQNALLNYCPALKKDIEDSNL